MSDADDARRYRYLKKRVHIVDEDGGWASHFEFPNIPRHNDSPNKAWNMPRRTLDQAIDEESLRGSTASGEVTK